MFNANETRKLAKSFYDGILAQDNVGHLACLLNLKGDASFMAELFNVRGFRDLLAASLPPAQRDLGHLAK